jgi:serine protease
MKFKQRLPQLCRALFSLLVLGIGTSAAVHARAGQRPGAVPGEIILYMQPGTPAADATALAATVQPDSVKALLLKDCYVIELPAARKNDADTTTAVAKLKADPRVRWVKQSPRYYPLQAAPAPPQVNPNDPLYAQQWNLKLINMPSAWTLQKGAPLTNVAWIDSGFDPKHEDTLGRYDPGSFDMADNDSDVTADGSDPLLFDHGTHTSGVAIANANNGIGIAGIDWQNINMVALKVVKKGTGPGFDFPSILNSYAYVAAHVTDLHIVACNMSYGGPGDPADTSSPEYIGIKQCVDKGVIMVAAAGNSSGDNAQLMPAALPFVITVSAVGPSGKLAPYSSFGKVELAAPGGDQQTSADDPNGILSLINDPVKKYQFAQGTSDAAPHVTAVAALLRSVAGVTPARAIQAMETTANRASITGSLPDPKYGFGLLDAYAALLLVSVSVEIDDPQGVDPTGATTNPNGQAPPPVETFKPQLRFKVANITPDQVTITIDPGQPTQQVIAGAAITSNIESGNVNGPNPQYTIAFRFQFPMTGVLQHTIVISGTNPGTGITKTDTRQFTITPHVIPGGVSLISIPYFEAPADSPTGVFRDVKDLLAPNAVLFRWENIVNHDQQGNPLVSGQYLAFGNGSTDINASLQPTDTVPTLDHPNPTEPTDIRPVGIGYFISAAGPIAVMTNGRQFGTTAFRIPLHEGWNMVGDPYAFAVPFNTAQVETNAGDRLTLATAVDQNLMLPYIFRFVNGEYDYQTLPAGTFVPWEGHWIYVVPKSRTSFSPGTALTMILSPTPEAGIQSRAARTRAGAVLTSTRPSGAGTWTLRLEARADSLKDTNNFIGVTTRAAANTERNRVPKPPMPSPFVSLGVTRPNAAAGLYAQDLQPAGGVKSWDVVVATDKANTTVNVTWPDIASVPRNYRLTLTDKVTGQSVEMRHTGSYQFNSGHSAGSRSFTLTAQPTTAAGRAVFTSVTVNPSHSRGDGSPAIYEIGYTVSQDVQVEVTVLSSSGKVLSHVSPTRAISTGANHLVWNGRDSAGRPVPAGPYVLQMRAITSDGEVTRDVRPFIISGR